MELIGDVKTMPEFGAASLIVLEELHPELKKLFLEVIKVWDCQLIDGARSVAEQTKNVAKGVSKTMESRHIPDETGKANACDAMPYPYDWNKIELGLRALKAADPSMQIAEVYMFIGFIKGVAHMMGIDLRQGADWNGNNQLEDHTFIDLPHHERRKK
jgi:peptidoglycan L-alanyl-D-glutamate endopeptidase CwlK